jgi:hypothetical protein
LLGDGEFLACWTHRIISHLGTSLEKFALASCIYPASLMHSADTRGQFTTNFPYGKFFARHLRSARVGADLNTVCP